IRGAKDHQKALAEAAKVKWADPPHLSTTLDPAAIEEATRDGAARILVRLSTEIMEDTRSRGSDFTDAHPVADTAYRVVSLLKNKSNPREFDEHFPGYEHHLTIDQLREAM